MKAAAARAPQADPVCRFDPLNHEYYIDDVLVPSITQMLTNCCYIDDTYFTEESRRRGTIVHKYAADFDNGGLEQPESLMDEDLEKSNWKAYVLAYVKAMKDIGRPKWDHIEVAMGHPTLRFGGRPDRVGKLWSAVSVLDIKTGGTYDWHGLQLALQAILVADLYKLPPESIIRWGLVLRANGRYSLTEHKDRRDFERAYEVIRKCTK